MHLNDLDIDAAARWLPTTGDKITSIVSADGIRRDRDTSERAQIIRVLDVMLLGPAMVYAGMGKDLPEGLKALMLLTGLGTILYNGYNLIENSKKG